MAGLEPKVRARLQKHRKDARKMQRTCYFPHCGETAIASHILQKRGILSRISEENLVIELREDDMFQSFPQPNEAPHPYFTAKGLNEAFTFLGFCPRHDKELFHEIEDGGADLTAERSVRLLSYRAFLNEMQKVQNNRNWWARCASDPDLLQFRAGFQKSIADFALNAALLQRTKRFLEAELGFGEPPPPSDLSEGPNTFVFEHAYIERVEVCTSAYYGYAYATDDVRDEIKRRLRAGVDPGFDESMHFINIFPVDDDRTLVILAVRGDDLPRSLDRSYVSEALLKWLETWACSPRWYRDYLKPREERIIAEWRRLFPPNNKQRLSPDFDLFAI